MLHDLGYTNVPVMNCIMLYYYHVDSYVTFCMQQVELFF